MANSPILAIPLLSTNQSNKETTINDAINFLEVANNAAKDLSLASGDVTLALLDIQRFFLFRITGATAPRNLTIPSATKVFAIDNSQNGNQLTLTRGAVVRTMGANTAAVFYVNGNNLIFLYYSANGGSIPFTFLSDAPSSYTGAGGRFLRVKSDLTGLEFADAGASISTFLQLTDVPDAYSLTNGGVVRVKADLSGVEFGKIKFNEISDGGGAFAGKGGYYLRINEAETAIEYTLSSSLGGFLDLTDTPDDFTGQAGKFVVVAPDESGLMFSNAAGGGVSTFTSLTDVPGTYEGKGGMYVRVSEGENGLEFLPSGEMVDSLTDLTDFPSNYTGAAGFFLRVREDLSGLEFFLPDTYEEAPSDGEIYGRQDGEWVVVSNDGGGGGIADAPADGKTYARKDAAWVQMVPVIAAFAAGTMTASETLFRFIAPVAMTMKAADATASSGVAATGATTLTIKVNGANAGTITFAAGATAGTVAFSSDISLTAGQVLSIQAPTTPDATLADVSVTFKGV